MIFVAMFIAGLFSEMIVTGQTLMISKRFATRAAWLALCGWLLWGTVLHQIVIDYHVIIPFAGGAAVGTYLVTKYTPHA